jgi:hypothetical protein
MEIIRNFKGNHYEFHGTPRNSQGNHKEFTAIHKEF